MSSGNPVYVPRPTHFVPPVYFGGPAVVTRPGEYLTRGGEVVVVESVEPRGPYGVRGRYRDGVKDTWDMTGRLLPGTLSQNDIVLPREYAHEDHTSRQG